MHRQKTDTGRGRRTPFSSRGRARTAGGSQAADRSFGTTLAAVSGGEERGTGAGWAWHVSQVCTDTPHSQSMSAEGRVDAPRDLTQVNENTAADFSCFWLFCLIFSSHRWEETDEAAVDLPVPHFTLIQPGKRQGAAVRRGGTEEEPMFN